MRAFTGVSLQHSCQQSGALQADHTKGGEELGGELVKGTSAAVYRYQRFMCDHSRLPNVDRTNIMF